MSDATTFHRSLPGYAPTPLRPLAGVAAELGLGAVWLKDESDRLGLPAFKILGASWAAERALQAAPGTHTLVAASAGNHGRAVAHVAAMRGLRARIFLPERSAPARRAAIAAEGAEVVIVDGTYEEACAAATAAAAADGALEIADVGAGPSAADVIDGYATLFAEIDVPVDVLLVPVGVGSLAAAAARWGRAHGVRVIGVEPERAACLTASLAAGEPVVIETPGTAMAGMDCAAVSAAAWPDLRDGIDATATVTDDGTRSAMRALDALGLRIGECGAAPLAALPALALAPGTRVVLVATEGRTALPPSDGCRAVVAALRAAGIDVALGGSGLLAAHGLLDAVRDWDLTTDADLGDVTRALDAAGIGHRHGAPAVAPFASRARVSVGDDVDLIVGFAATDAAGAVVPLPTLVRGTWNGLPLGDLEVWRRAYRLLGRPERAALIT